MSWSHSGYFGPLSVNFLPESTGSTISSGPEEGARGEGEKPVLAEEITKADGYEAVL